ncbi:MAG TPA: FAD-dependent oxidoreductase [Gaiellaceae bacterium]|nr:FAD-dependent oxidoreductase [Gaiellaceae bacterium]
MSRPSVLPGAAPAWWIQDADDGDRSAPLAADLDVDVAIVGGGFTGLWTALALRAHDDPPRVALLEAEFCGWGPSGRNGGFCHGYWSYLPTLRELFGDAAALELCRAGDRIVPGIRSFLVDRGEDAWLREGGMLQVSATPSQDAAVDAHVAAAREVGHPDEAVLRESPGISPRFRRAAFYRDGATVHPARLVRALRRAALADGVALYEGTRARLRSDGTLEANGRTVRARDVVVATNAAGAEWRPVRGRLTVFGSYVVLTEPVPDLLDAIGWTGGEAIYDSRMFLHYFRTTEDGRVLMGSGSGPIGRGARIDRRFTHDAPTAARAEEGLRRLLPALSEARVEASWGGPIDVSADHVPFIGTVRGTRVHYALGFSGHGVGPSWLAGRALASLARGAEDEWTRLPLVDRRVATVPREPFRHLGGSAIRAAILALEEAEEHGRRPPRPARAVAAVPRLLGMRLGQR